MRWGEVRVSRLLDLAALGGAMLAVLHLATLAVRGAWPWHDAAAYYVAGLHLREGAPVYQAAAGEFLAFLYPPPMAVVAGALSYLPPDLFVGLLTGLEVLALRYVVGSWRNAGLACWLPFVVIELRTGNVNLLLAAAMLASLRGVRWSGVGLAFAGVAKFAPVAVLVGSGPRRWAETILAGVVLLAVTLPWLHLWPAWWATVASAGLPGNTLPLAPRIPLALVLLAYRRPWSVAAGAALLTPAFYEHSLVLLFPALALLKGYRFAGSRWGWRRLHVSRTPMTPRA
jgi:hypothetical protein